MQASGGNYYGANAQEGAHRRGYVYRIRPAGIASITYATSNSDPTGVYPVATTYSGTPSTISGSTGTHSFSLNG